MLNTGTRGILWWAYRVHRSGGYWYIMVSSSYRHLTGVAGRDAEAVPNLAEDFGNAFYTEQACPV